MYTMWYEWFQNTIIDTGDPRTKGWFLVDSPTAPIYIMLIYFVFVTRVGPNLMRNRKPLNIRPLILVYNVIQVCSCLTLIYMAGSIPFREKLSCIEILIGDDYRDQKMPSLGWIYYMQKYLDLSDTIFFVLTKKQCHITRLHLFHHVSMVFAIWMGIKYYPSGALAIAPYLNLWVHSIMYTYYFCALHFGPVRVAVKKLITSIQLVQFVSATIIFIVHLCNPWCSFPKLILIPIILHGFCFIYMFANFYTKTYMVRRKIE